MAGRKYVSKDLAARIDELRGVESVDLEVSVAGARRSRFDLIRHDESGSAGRP